MSLRIYLFVLISFLVGGGCSLHSLQPTDRDGVVKEKGGRESVIPTSLRADAVVELLRSGEFVKGRATIVVKGPDLFRIEVFGPFNQTVFVLVGNGGGLSVYSKGDVRTYRWDDPFLPYSFRSRDVVSFLTGAPYMLDERENYSILTHRGRITGFIRSNRDGPVFKVSMGDYREIGGVSVPFSISVVSKKETLKITYRSVEVEPSLNAEVFTLGAIR